MPTLTIDKVVENTLAGLHKVDADIARPDDATAERLVRAILHEDGFVAILRNPRRNAAEDERAFHGIVKFHLSSGVLDGYMYWRLMLGDAEFDKLDTLAVVFILANGGRCRAAERWEEVLHR